MSFSLVKSLSNSSQLADIMNLINKPIRANKNRFGVILDDPCDSLTGWTVTGSVTVSSGKFNFGASSNIIRPVTLSKVMPTIITCEITKAGRTSGGLYLLDASNAIVGSVGFDLDAEHRVYTYSPSTGNENATIYNDTNPFRLYMLYDPIKGVVKGFVQDNGTSGAKYFGSSAVTGVPTQLKILTGGILTVNPLIDNIIVSPSFCAVIGDSRVAGHTNYDPYPGYYAGDDNPIYAFCYDFYKDTGVYLINDGVGSTKTEFNLARITNTIQFNPKVIIIGPSNLGETVETFENNFAAMATACINAGIKPIIMEIPPCNQSQFDSDLISINTWLENYCKSYGMQFIKLYDLLANGTDGTDLNSIFDVGDGIHWSEVGARFVANLIADAIA